MLVVCVSFPEFKIWIFKGDDILGKRGISIGKHRSIYINNEFKKENVESKLLDFYQNCNKKSIEELMIPTSFSTKKEHKNRLTREKILHGLTFTYPIMDGAKYDAIINGYKVQDKCTRIRKCKYLFVDLDDDYVKDDNAFYWFNNPDESIYIIPESELLNKNDNTIKKSINLSAYYNQFKYGPVFTEETIQKITMLFQPIII